MPIPAGPGGQREAWRGLGAAAGLFWRPVTLAQIPPRPQECRSLPSPRPGTPPRPLRQSPSAEGERASDRASEPGSGPRAGLQRASPGPARASPTDPRPSAARGRARATAGPRFISAPDAARQEPRGPTSTRTLDSHTHTHTRSAHVDGETKTRTEPRKLEARSNAGPRRCAGPLGRRWPKQERRNSRGRTFPEAARGREGARRLIEQMKRLRPDNKGAIES